MSANSIRRAVAACALLIAASASASPEWTPTRAFRTFSKSSWRGLPQSSVMALAQDRDGILWIGTLDGAATFDGRTITPVDAVAGAPLRGLIPAIAARARGGVYVASQAGVHVYDGTTWRLFATKHGPSSIAEAKDGTLWLADTTGALFTLAANGTWTAHREAGAPIMAVAAAPDGAVWAATERSAVRIANGRAEAVAGPPLTAEPAALLVAHDGIVWTATQGCTIHWTRGGADGWHQVAFAPWPRGAFRSLAEDRRGRIWGASYGGRVAFGNATMPWTVWDAKNGPFEAGVMSVLGDREGSVWFGINAVGMTQWIGESWSHRPVVDPENPTRMAFAAFGIAPTAKRDGLLVSVFSAGVLRLGPGNAVKLYGANEGITEDVRAAAEPEPGTIYVGARFGLFESIHGSRFTQVLKIPSGFGMGFFESPDHRWYAATSSRGVFVRDASGWRAVDAINSALDSQHVRDMTWMRNRELWVATLRGITIFRGGAAPRHLTSAIDAAIPESVNAVLEMPDGDVWAAGTGGIAIRHAGKWRRMTETDGMPGQTAYSLALARDGAVWAGGSAGVGRFANGRWTVWDSREGLLQEECNLNGLTIGGDGEVWAGTMGGLAHFDPTVKALPHPPLSLIWRGTMKPDGRALHLHWVAPWLGAHPVQYRVRVPRLHDAWSAPTAEDHLDVENLAAGDWRVEVEARVEGDRDWSAPLALEVAIPPFWFETFPARLAFGLLLALAIYAIVRLRIRALHRHAAMLEATVRERTAALRESEQRALAASRAKSAFLANMSHELRTPLNGILGFAQLLARRRNRDAEDREGLDVIVSSGEHLLGLINDVLSLSKIEAGRITLDETTFDVRRVVRDVEHLLRLRAEEKGLRFTTELDAALPAAVSGDEVRLRQILLNLAGNAVKFTESGSVTLRARWRDGRAQFEVVDTGPGIAANELPRLFAPFVQSETGHKSKEGTGLGLALSRNLAQLMGGDITAESTVGRGSCFRVDVALPEAKAEVAVAREERRVVALAPGEEPRRILVVDDTTVNRAVLVKLLAPVGFDVREASSADEALATWREWQPHLIWMDKRMSGVDGLDVTRIIRKEEGSRRTAIIALSASALEHERGEILAAGCDDFVAKPYRESTIFAKLAEHLGVRYAYESDAVPRDGAPSVLLVDDDWICRRVATEMLQSNGIGVTTASSGREALDLFDANRFDLVLMDLHMPDMGGVETARRMKAKARLPIIAMSADTFDGEATRLRDAGMDDYVGKPVEAAALEQVLRRWLRTTG